MKILEKIKKTFIRHKIYHKFVSAIKSNTTYIYKLDRIYDKQLGTTRNIISLAHKYNLPIIVNDTYKSNKQYLSRMWFDSDVCLISLSDVLNNKELVRVDMALCDLDDAGYSVLPNFDELYRYANIVIGAAKITTEK